MQNKWHINILEGLVIAEQQSFDKDIFNKAICIGMKKKVYDSFLSMLNAETTFIYVGERYKSAKYDKARKMKDAVLVGYGGYLFCLYKSRTTAPYIVKKIKL